MKKIILFIFIISILGCSRRDYVKYEEGYIWGRETHWRGNQFTKPFGEKQLKIAKEGYIYSLAAAVSLQNNSTNALEAFQHMLFLPDRLKLVESYKDSISGFEVQLFELYSKDNPLNLEELIISFVGSNDWKDWIYTNFGGDKRQYKLARTYVENIAFRNKYKDIDIVVTGYSLGGGLAIHVTRNEETSKYIKKTWAFNPSPKTNSDNMIDDRIWVAGADKEVLKFVRKNKNVSETQTSLDFYLVKSSIIYDHFRWTLAIDLLHVADRAFYEDAIKQGKDPNMIKTEPQEIIENSYFAASKKIKSQL